MIQIVTFCQRCELLGDVNPVISKFGCCSCSKYTILKTEKCDAKLVNYGVKVGLCKQYPLNEGEISIKKLMEA